MSRYRMADAVAIGLALGYGALMVTIGDATAPGAAVPWPVDVAIGVICAGALPLRRRWPLAWAVVLVPCGPVSVRAAGAIVTALFALALCCRAPVALLTAAATVATGAVSFLTQDTPPYPFWLDIVLRGVVSAAITGW